MSTSGIKAGRAYVELGVNDKFTSALRAAQAKLKAFGASVRVAGYAISGASTAAAAPLAASVKVFSSTGDAIAKAAKRTGLTTEAMSELGFAAEQSGSDMEGLEKGIRAMQKNVTDAAAGTGEASDALKTLGLSASDLLAKSPEDMFMAIAAEIGKIQDPTKRAAAAMDIFGARIGTGLLPLMAEGEAGIAALRKQAHDFGISLSGKDAKAAEELNDSMNLASRSVRGLMMRIGAALAPVVTDLANRFTSLVATVGIWVDRNRGVIVAAAKIIGVVGAVGATLISLGVTFAVLAAAVGGIATVFGGAVAAVTAILSPLGAVVGLAAACTAAFLLFSGAGGAAIDWLSERFGDLQARAGEALGGIVNALKAGDLAQAATVAWLYLKAEWIRGTSWLAEIWEGFKAWFLDTALSAAQALEDFFGPDIWYPLEVAAIETIATLTRIWTNFAAFMRSTWESVTGWVADRLLDIQGMFDETLDVEAAKAGRRATDDVTQRNIEQGRQRDIAAVDQKLVERRAAAEARERERINTGKSWIGGAREAVKSAMDEALSANNAELAAAMDELRAATEKANSLASSDSPALGLAKIPEARESAAESLSSARGVFASSSAALLSLEGSTQSQLNRIATATEATARDTKKIANKTGDTPVFGGS